MIDWSQPLSIISISSFVVMTKSPWFLTLRRHLTSQSFTGIVCHLEPRFPNMMRLCSSLGRESLRLRAGEALELLLLERLAQRDFLRAGELLRSLDLARLLRGDGERERLRER